MYHVTARVSDTDKHTDDNLTFLIFWLLLSHFHSIIVYVIQSIFSSPFIYPASTTHSPIPRYNPLSRKLHLSFSDFTYILECLQYICSIKAMVINWLGRRDTKELPHVIVLFFFIQSQFISFLY